MIAAFIAPEALQAALVVLVFVLLTAWGGHMLTRLQRTNRRIRRLREITEELEMLDRELATLRPGSLLHALHRHRRADLFVEIQRLGTASQGNRRG